MLVSAGDVVAVHAFVWLMFMSEAIRPSAWPYSDSAAPDAVAG